MRRLFVVANFFTYAQLMDVQCKSYCQFGAGYDSGIYVEVSKQCWCADRINMQKLNEKKLVLPGKQQKTKFQPSVPYKPAEDSPKFPWEDD